jgi:N-(2-amino-2-carboxyethyl)-L-glutamate synthase
MSHSESSGVALQERTLSGVLSAIGDTPLVRLERMFAGSRATVFAKLEMFNPMGSAKDRAAVSMVLAAIEEGRVVPGQTTVIESTSGNTGLALASVCKYFHLPLICVVDGRMTGQHGRLLRAFGVTIDEVTVPDPATGELLPARLKRVQDLLAQHQPSFWPNQYSNIHNARAHMVTCGEIFDQLGRAPDYILCATGTCGTLRGCADFVNSRGAHTRLIAVDAVGSRIFGSAPQRRIIPGLGSAIRPPLVEGIVVYRVVHVSEAEAVAGSRRLLENEAILAGGSSGAIMSALARCDDIHLEACTVVAVLADSGERYLDTIYDDQWVDENIALEPADLAHA